jgi:ketosteroid isomerase-like protein
MDAKEITKKGYELFNSGDMQTFFTDIVHDDITWTFPGKEGKHPLSGVHKGKEAVMAAMSKIPATWNNFHLTPEFMISEGDKVFVKVNAKADGMDTVFGHYFEVKDGKMITMMTFDDTLSMFDSMNK